MDSILHLLLHKPILERLCQSWLKLKPSYKKSCYDFSERRLIYKRIGIFIKYATTTLCIMLSDLKKKKDWWTNERDIKDHTWRLEGNKKKEISDIFFSEWY